MISGFCLTSPSLFVSVIIYLVFFHELLFTCCAVLYVMCICHIFSIEHWNTGVYLEQACIPPPPDACMRYHRGLTGLEMEDQEMEDHIS